MDRERKVAALIKSAADLDIYLDYESLSPTAQAKHAALSIALCALYDDMAAAGLAPVVP